MDADAVIFKAEGSIGRAMTAQVAQMLKGAGSGAVGQAGSGLG
jgi:hypothetical protein